MGMVRLALYPNLQIAPDVVEFLHQLIAEVILELVANPFETRENSLQTYSSHGTSVFFP
jgi:hypothetical protein